MSLQKYWEKRDFKITPEPKGNYAVPGQQLTYFIQRHHARRLHYDFRLELEGTLKSWAVPKGPSLDPHDKRLAVHVEDHPLAYGTFEGDIPPHQYGAGHVVLWDFGTWTPLEDPVKGYRKGMLKFRLDGIKLKGTWALVRMPKREEDKDNWLLIKERDEEAKSGDAAQITELRQESVKNLAAKSLPAQASKTKKKPSRPGSNANPVNEQQLPLDFIQVPKEAPESAMPEKLQPQLATYVEQAPEGEEWLSEVKFDGYRALCRLENGKAQLYSRNGNDWSAKWHEIAEAAASLPAKQAWLDGEVVAIDAEGKVSFQALQNLALNDEQVRLAYYVFDLLYLNGHDLRDLPLLQRKQLLESLLKQVDPQGPLLYSSHIQGNADEVFHHACMHSMEGIVVKRADAPYQQTRTRSWLKVKCFHRQEFVIGGYTEPAGSREGFGALLLGVYDDKQQLRYAGRVGTGFDTEMLNDLAAKFAKLEQKSPPFANPPTGAQARGVHWMKPSLVGEVHFAQWTDAGIIRHASFTALREDKPARAVRHENALNKEEVLKITQEETSQPRRKAGKRGGQADSGDSRAHESEPAESPPKGSGDTKNDIIAGVKLSSPSKILFSAAGLTKHGLAGYYEQAADWLLPHLQNRPLTLVRCPNGGDAKCFFQKHVTDTTADNIERITVPEENSEALYMMANDLDSVISLVQMGVLELHTWGSHLGALEKPDRIIFDLDPAEGLPWHFVTEAAQLVGGLLKDIGLTSYVKTTGGKGLHVVVPIQPEFTWDVVKPFTKAFAEHLAMTLPDRFTANMAKAKRVDRIFIDYLRNGSGATAVAAYSTRAKPDASVSAPISWDELGPDIRANTFNALNMMQRLRSLKTDPWQGYFTSKQRLTKKMLQIFST